MFALVESGSITKMLSGNQGIIIDGVQHPRAIYTLWTEAERNAIGIYTVEIDESKKKDDKWYINTDITYSFGSNKVTGSYGDATAKAHADAKWTQSEIDDGLAPDGVTLALQKNLKNSDDDDNNNNNNEQNIINEPGNNGKGNSNEYISSFDNKAITALLIPYLMYVRNKWKQILKKKS